MPVTTRHTGRSSKRFRLAPIHPDLHAIYKVQAAQDGTTITELLYLDACRARNLDPRTLQPIVANLVAAN